MPQCIQLSSNCFVNNAKISISNENSAKVLPNHKPPIPPDPSISRNNRATPSAKPPIKQIKHHQTKPNRQKTPKTNMPPPPPHPPPPFPEPLIIPPLSLPHEQTFILLHGRGSCGSRFGPELISTPFLYPNNTPPFPSQNNPPSPANPSPPRSPNNTNTPPPPNNNINNTPLLTQTLQTCFPHAKFIFPNAPYSRATIYKRSLITQWFNSWDVSSPSTWHRNAWMMIDGLQQTTAYLHDLICHEARELPFGAAGVAVGGISQGCAASLVAVMLWEGEALGAWLGICGWLPFGKELAVDGRGDGDGFDPFDREDEVGDGGGEESDVGAAAVKALREMLELDTGGKSDCRPAVFNTPMFWGHGSVDDKVPEELGRTSADCLASFGFDVEWHTYNGLGHWFSGEMIRDMAQFLEGKVGCENVIKMNKFTTIAG